MASYTDADFQAFVWALVQQESNGRYDATNPSGALGAYQVLGSNVPSWSQAALGHSITAQQYLADPRLQDSVAQYQLLKDWNAAGGTPEQHVLAVAHDWNPDADTSYGNEILARWQTHPGTHFGVVSGTSGIAAPAPQTDWP